MIKFIQQYIKPLYNKSFNVFKCFTHTFKKFETKFFGVGMEEGVQLFTKNFLL